MDRRLNSISLQFGQFVGHGGGGGADLRLAVIRGDEEAQAGGAGGGRRGEERGDGDGAGGQGRGEEVTPVRKTGGGLLLVAPRAPGAGLDLPPPQLASDLESVPIHRSTSE